MCLREFKKLKGALGVQYPAFAGDLQQDTDELMRILLNKVHTELKPYSEKSCSDTEAEHPEWMKFINENNTFIGKNFYGITETKHTCKVCLNSSSKYMPTLIISLPIQTKAEQQLSECMDNYLASETVNEKDMFCDICRDNRAADHQISFCHHPEVLIVHLNRFNSATKKIETPVKIPLRLCLKSGDDRGEMCSETYDLIGVSNHYGGMYGGHYTSYVKKENRWFFCNDDTVTPMSQDNVSTKDAYLVVYEKNLSTTMSAQPSSSSIDQLKDPLTVCSALYSSTDDVVELTAANFNSLVVQSSELWFVEFYAPWCDVCVALAPEWKKAATALKDIVKVGAVDMTEHQSVGAPYGIQGFPTIKVFGSNKQNPQDYQGHGTAQGIVDAALNHVKNLVVERLTGKSGGKSGGDGGANQKPSGDGKDVVELTDNNFAELVLEGDDMWLVEFYAPRCDDWAQVAGELNGKVKLGALDATVHTVMASRFGVQGYPSIKMFPAGQKDGETVEFDGGRTSDDIVAWALDKLDENVPAPDVKELIEESVLKAACEEHQLCIVAILPRISDCPSECRNRYLDILRTLGEKHKKRMWGWVWAEAGSQPELEESLNIGSFGYPVVAALNARDLKFSLHTGSFSEEGINEFLLEAAVGRSSTEPVKNGILPGVKQIPAWDAKDS